MWVLLDRQSTSDGPERVLPSVEALSQFASEIGDRLRGVQVDGVGGALALSERLHAVLDGVSDGEVERARATVRALHAWLVEAARRLAILRRVKQEIEAPTPDSISGRMG